MTRDRTIYQAIRGSVMFHAKLQAGSARPSNSFALLLTKGRTTITHYDRCNPQLVCKTRSLCRIHLRCTLQARPGFRLDRAHEVRQLPRCQADVAPCTYIRAHYGAVACVLRSRTGPVAVHHVLGHITTLLDTMGIRREVFIWVNAPVFDGL